MQERIRPSPPQSIPPHTTMPHADWIESQRKRVRLEHGPMIMIHVYTSRWDLVWFGDQPQPTPAKITLFIYYDGVTVQCLTLSKLYVDSQLSNCSGDPLVILDSEWMFRNDVRICSQRIYKVWSRLTITQKPCGIWWIGTKPSEMDRLSRGCLYLKKSRCTILDISSASSPNTSKSQSKSPAS